jgi:hypothetical protein
LDVIENKGEEYIIGLSSKSVDKEASIKVVAEYAGDIELDDWNLSSQVELNMGYQPFTLTPSPSPRTGEGSRIFPPSPVLGEGVRG